MLLPLKTALANSERSGNHGALLFILEALSSAADEAAAQAETVGKKILATINRSNMLSGTEHQATASIGITLFCIERIDSSPRDQA